MTPPHKLEAVRRANRHFAHALTACSICPRRCGVDRAAGTLGYCRSGALPTVYSYGPHHGEEPPISGTRGSGTIFFSHCNMRCVYCQNYPFSQSGAGTQVSIERLAGIMLELQESGCHNINLVTPTHVVPQVLQALEIALTKGLTLPIVYNTSGYELVETLRLLEGIIDIYLPDMRYADDAMAARYSDAPDYASRDRPAVREMHRQVGDLAMGKDGIATRGLIIRLLALPQGISGTIDSLAFIKKEASPHTSLSIMSQYHPTYKASSYTELSQGVSRREYKNIVDEAGRLGLNNGWIQEMPDDTDTRFLGTNIPPRNG